MKEQYFCEWLRSRDIDDFGKLKDLVSVEELKACVNRDLKLHLEELKLDTLQEVAIASDEYVLSHRTYNNPYGKWRNPTNANKGAANKGNTSGDNSPEKGKGEGFSNNGSPKMGYKSGGALKDIECYFCRQKGHFRSQCHKYKKFLEQEKNL